MADSEELAAVRARRNALRREQYAVDGGKRKAYNQAWKDAHREKVRKAGREYQRERRKDAFVSVEERKRAAEWKKNNPEKAKKTYDTFLKNNPGYHAEWHRRNREKNPVLYLWRSARNRAKKDGIAFTITQDDLVVPEYCPALGLKLVVGKGAFTDECASIDRVIPELGYIPGNVRVISMRANVLKRNATPEELMAVARYAKEETDRVRALFP